MTTYYELSGSANPYNNDANWDDSGTWTPQGVPDSVNDGVILNPVTENGAPASLVIFLNPSESYTIGSLQVPANDLFIFGSLSVANNVNVSGTGEINVFGGSLSAGHIVVNGGGLDGVGSVTSSGSLEIQTQAASGTAEVYTSATTLTLSGATVYNTGTLWASTNSTLLVEASQANGLLNFSNGTLGGGTYRADIGGTLDLKTDGEITTDAATLVFTPAEASGASGPGVIASYNPADGEFINIEQTLSTIASSGVLEVTGATFAVEYGLTVAGKVELSQGVLGAHFLTIGQGGSVSYSGSSSATALSVDVGFLTDNGRIEAAATSSASTSMLIQPIVEGSGSIVVGPQVSATIDGFIHDYTASVTLENAASANIVFSDNTGTATLGTPGQFTGAFQGFVKGDAIVLSGVALSSVTGTSYSGTSTSGVLTIDEGSASIKLAFDGDYTSQSFALSAGAGSASSVVISDTGISAASAAHVALIGVHPG